jgi:hypothetical protein
MVVVKTSQQRLFGKLGKYDPLFFVADLDTVDESRKNWLFQIILIDKNLTLNQNRQV